MVVTKLGVYRTKSNRYLRVTKIVSSGSYQIQGHYFGAETENLWSKNGEFAIETKLPNLDIYEYLPIEKYPELYL